MTLKIFQIISNLLGMLNQWNLVKYSKISQMDKECFTVKDLVP